MTHPQWFSALTGLIVCLVGLGVFVRVRVHRFKALFWMAVGVAMVYAGFRPHVIEFLGADSNVLRVRLVVALLSFAVLTVTLEAIRIGRMQERDAFLWMAAGLVLFIGAMFPGLANLVSRVTGMRYASGVLVVLLTFVLFMLFYVSVTLGRMQSRQARIARELALAEERLRVIESKMQHVSDSPDLEKRIS